MKNKLHIISMALLGLYSFVLLHDMIPHFHLEDLGETTESLTKVHDIHNDRIHHDHEHNKHHSKQKSEHEHFTHKNHHDHGLFDYLTCVLSEAEHPAADIDHCYYASVETGKNSNNWTARANLVTVLSAALIGQVDLEPTIKFGQKVVNSYLPPPLLSSPHRGPPPFLA